MALTKEQELFVRATWTIDVSVTVMWKFVEEELQRQSPSCQKHLQLWWTKESSKVYGVECMQEKVSGSWMYHDIFYDDPDKWDISVLHTAIIGCTKIHKEEGKYHPYNCRICSPVNIKSSLCCLRDQRNYLFHQRPLVITQTDYNDLVDDSKGCYRLLLKGKSNEFEKRLDELTKCDILDETIANKLHELEEKVRHMDDDCNKKIKDMHQLWKQGMNDGRQSKRKKKKRAEQHEQDVSGVHKAPSEESSFSLMALKKALPHEEKELVKKVAETVKDEADLHPAVKT